MKLPIACVVTRNCLKEFLLLKFSIERFHQCEWYLSCDAFSSSYLRKFENVHSETLIQEEGDHVVSSEESNDKFTRLMLKKFDACRMAMLSNSFVMLIDADMLFVGPIEEKILELVASKRVDAAICPHMTDFYGDERITGYFNCGMVLISSSEFIDTWNALSVNHKLYNLYYEQKPLELIARRYVTLNLPINYNIGWWRFMSPFDKSRIQNLLYDDKTILFMGLPAVNFHLHLFKKLLYTNQGAFLKDKILDLLASSGQNEIIEKIKELENENI